MFRPSDTKARASILLLSQAGRITSYMVAGGILGFAGAELYGLFDQSLAYSVLQWAAAVTLIGIGLSVAGLLPPLSGLDRLVSPLMGHLMRITPDASNSRMPVLTPYLSGLIWGLIPCAMVYAALFTAMLTGSAQGGLIMMAGFGMGTIPAVLVSALGITSLSQINAHGAVRTAIGLSIAGLGIGSVVINTYMPQVLCLI